MARRFGPTRGAGVAIEEQEGDKQITPAALGMVGYAGVLQRGAVGELIVALDKKTFQRKCGRRIPDDSELPDVCEDYYDLANGAGGILLVRVTDGNELQSEDTLYVRRATRQELGTLRAKNGGRWGGRKRNYTDEVATIATDITETTLDTGLATFTTDMWKGGYIELDGVPNSRYKITGNDSAGVITVETDSTMNSDLTGGADPTNARYYLVLEDDGTGLSWETYDGEENPDTEFGLDIYLDGDLVRSYPNLSTDPTSGRYWVNVLDDDSLNEYVEGVDNWVGAHTATVRPANYYGKFTSLTATVLTAGIADFAINSAGGGDPTFALGTTTDDHLEQVITLTMTDPTNFTAESDRFGALGSGTLGTEFTPNNKWTPPFTVTAGGTALDAADTLTVTYKPLEPDTLEGGELYPDKVNDRRLFYRIVSNTHNTITVAGGSDMASDVTVTAGVAATGQITAVATADFVDGETFVLDDGESPAITFHINQTGGFTPGGGYDATNIEVDVSGNVTADDNATAIQTAINGVAGLNITAGAPAAADVPLTADNTGTQANNAILETVANAGFAVTGMSGGVDATEDEFMVVAPKKMREGRDGVADLTDTDYTSQAWDTGSSPFNNVIGKNFGLIKFATPGNTATVVQKAGVAYAFAKNHQYRYEVPSNIADETAVDSYINDTLGRNDYAVVSFPSRGSVPDPDSTDGLLMEMSLTGMVHGREARMAADWKGYHKAEAGEDAILPEILKIPTGDTVLNEEYLNPLGINVIKKKKGNFILWGDRTLYLDPAWKWKHQRELMSYYEHVLQENFDFIIFAINDPDTQDQLITTLTAFFLPEWGKRALRGATFEDAAVLKIDGENNTDATRADGDLFADIALRLADTVERFVIRIGKQGLFEDVA